MFRLNIDTKKNTLYLSFSGHFDSDQGKQLCAVLKGEVSRLKKGFRIITDLTNLDFMDVDSAPAIEKVMDMCNENGVRTILRVIPDPGKDIGLNIMSSFHYSPNVKICTFKSLQELKHHLIINSDASPFDKIKTVLLVARMKVLGLLSKDMSRFSILFLGFAGLIILRTSMQKFGVSLGYIYITFICLSGFWFGIKGGVLAASAASLIFVCEVSLFKDWLMSEEMAHGMYLRVFAYYLSGSIIGYLSGVERKLRDRLEYSSGHDELTGCANFRLIMTLLEKDLNRSLRYEKNLSVAIIDLDRFKKINSKYGHLIGNDVLKEFGGILRNSVRMEDSVGRYGGEEFLIIYPELNAQQARLAVKRIQDELNNTKILPDYIIRKEKVDIKFSAGIATFPDHAKNVNMLINCADNALYKAKKAGRNKVTIFTKIF